MICQKTEKQIEGIKEDLMTIKEMRPGSLTLQTRKKKDVYKSYWHLSYTHQGKNNPSQSVSQQLESIQATLFRCCSFCPSLAEFV